MKKLILITLLMFSSTSYAEWAAVSKSSNGDTYYIDFDRIRAVDGYTYFWQMGDLVKPLKGWGFFSTKVYGQGDCKLFRYKHLSYIFYKEPMGGGDFVIHTPKGEDENWVYPAPDSSDERILNAVCDHVK